ncbi:MAG: hypothetical protein LBC61_00580 [Candidatus Peribacteria bacterium]|nr:hypothetical protein [Candidatus Peribacteria bacterium]
MKKTNSKIYVLLDVDVYNKADIDKLKSSLLKKNFIEIIFSNPSFDFFISLYLKSFLLNPSKDNEYYVDLVSKKFKNYRK